jgi:hypothetical protein
MYKMSIQELVDNLVKQIVSEHERDKEHLKEQLMSANKQEIEHLKSKLQTLAQNEDNYKFQKRTIASLTSEISNLDMRLKQADEEIRQLKINLRVQAAEQKKPAEPVKIKEQEPEPVQIKEPEPVQIKEESESTFSPDITTQELDLVPVVLRSGTYYWDPETNELYDYVSDELIGQSVGFIKAVKIRNLTYYLDPHDDSFYEVSPDAIGNYAGQIVNRKAIFTQK